MSERAVPPGVPAVRVEGVRKGYGSNDRRVEVLRGVSLELEQGEMLALVGPSGVGKSTFLHLLGLLDQPEAGRIELFGHDTGAMTSGQRASWRNRRIGFVFQFHGLLAEFTLTENVAMPLLIGGAGRREAAVRAGELLAAVGLEHRREHFPDQLSGGEQQRGAIARALVADPWLLLADEPTGNLDAATAESVFELLRNLHLDRGLSSVIVTHNARLAARCDRTLRLSGDGLEAA
ncbi:MAG TPA: ABC transporter ATP-binding protein [Thermoanaerobaculaceae bacterium]|nr:ABC transporter ATP-binding protein [Thermoanaerobaculaceae bacterium]HRS14729.1 ABC transporter ATP-binding protein [Thermoanaerobaculaceae bacterium]